MSLVLTIVLTVFLAEPTDGSRQLGPLPLSFQDSDLPSQAAPSSGEQVVVRERRAKAAGDVRMGSDGLEFRETPDDDWGRQLIAHFEIRNE